MSFIMIYLNEQGEQEAKEFYYDTASKAKRAFKELYPRCKLLEVRKG